MERENELVTSQLNLWAQSGSSKHNSRYHATILPFAHGNESILGVKKKRKRQREPENIQKVDQLSSTQAEALADLQVALLAWFDTVRNERSMPWRRQAEASAQDEDPIDCPPDRKSRQDQHAYQVWVSEVMLQQTQVATVIPYFNCWIEKWPTIHALSQATDDEARALWSGLGYYSRATRLLQSARDLQADPTLRGHLPKCAQDLCKVGGIGRYTAGAIASIVFGEKAPLVDGNVVRVFSRWSAAAIDPKGQSKAIEWVWDNARLFIESLKDDTQTGASLSGDWNQALMELGSTICTPKQPKCSVCPVARWCLARRQDELARKHFLKKMDDHAQIPEDIEDLCGLCQDIPMPDLASEKAFSVCNYPLVGKRTVQREEESVAILVQRTERNHQVLIVKRPDKGLLGGMWEIPTVLMGARDTSNAEERRQKARDFLRDQFAIRLDEKATMLDRGMIDHVFSHLKMRYYLVSVQIAEVDAETVSTTERVMWTTLPVDQDTHTLSGPAQRCFEILTRSEKHAASKKPKHSSNAAASKKRSKEMGQIQSYFKAVTEVPKLGQ